MTSRPIGCCGVCPPIAGGGYDCTCKGNPRCPNRIKVEPVRAANGRIQGWAIKRGNQELNFYRVTAWRNAHAQALIRAQQLAHGGTK